MSQPDEFLSRFNEPPDDLPHDPYRLDELRAMSHDALRDWVRRYERALHAVTLTAHPATTPANTAGGSAATETHGPA